MVEDSCIVAIVLSMVDKCPHIRGLTVVANARAEQQAVGL